MKVVLGVALAGQVDYLVTGNLSDYPVECRRGCVVVSPAQFMAVRRKRSQDEDLIVEAVKCQRAGEPFATVVSARQLDLSIGRCIADLEALAKAALPEGVPSAPRCLEDAVKFASWLTRAIADGTIDARTGHESAYALNCFKAAAEKRDLERQVADLQAQLKVFKSQRPRLA